MQVEQALLWLSLMALGIATIVEVIQMIRRRASTIITGWLIWSIVNLNSWVAQDKAGSTRLELWIPIGQLLSTTLLFVVTLGLIAWRGDWRKKETRNFGWGDGGAVVICLIGMGIMFLFDKPMAAIICNMLANVAGLAPVLWRARKSPGPVTRPYWLLRGTSSSLAGSMFMIPSVNIAGLIPQGTGILISWLMLFTSGHGRSRRQAA